MTEKVKAFGRGPQSAREQLSYDRAASEIFHQSRPYHPGDVAFLAPRLFRSNVTLAENANGTESLLTLRWREPDSNHGSREGVVGAFANFSGAVYSGLAVPRSAGETLVVYAASKKENNRGRR